MSNHGYDNKGPQVEFDIINEHWNHYTLNDRSKLRARMLLMRIFKDKTSSDLLLFEFSKPILVVICPDDMKGEVNNQPKPEEYSTLPTEEVIIEENFEEKWNEYSLVDVEKTTVKMKYTVSSVKRAQNRFDIYGCPFYFVTGAPAITFS